nr:glycosyltransferase [Bacillus pumilus]
MKSRFTNSILKSMSTLFGFYKQIEEWMHLSDVCVSTSLREGLGMNLLEAMSAEKPVIATENRGHCELIRHGVNGFLVKPHDVNDLAEYLHQPLS